MIFTISNDGMAEAIVRDAVGHTIPVQTIPLASGNEADTDGLRLVVVDGTSFLDRALDIVEHFAAHRAGIAVVLRADPTDEVLEMATEAGVGEVLAPTRRRRGRPRRDRPGLRGRQHPCPRTRRRARHASGSEDEPIDRRVLPQGRRRQDHRRHQPRRGARQVLPQPGRPRRRKPPVRRRGNRARASSPGTASAPSPTRTQGRSASSTRSTRWRRCSPGTARASRCCARPRARTRPSPCGPRCSARW